MAKSYLQLQQKLRFDELMGFLDAQFEIIPDHRADNTRYSLADVLKGGFAMFSLKSPSLLDFKNQSCFRFDDAADLSDEYVISALHRASHRSLKNRSSVAATA